MMPMMIMKTITKFDFLEWLYNDADDGYDNKNNC